MNSVQLHPAEADVTYSAPGVNVLYCPSIVRDIVVVIRVRQTFGDSGGAGLQLTAPPRFLRDLGCMSNLLYRSLIDGLIAETARKHAESIGGTHLLTVTRRSSQA